MWYFKSCFWIKTYKFFIQDESQISFQIWYWIHPKRIIEQHYMYIHPKSEQLLLSNQGISTIEHQFSTCKTCYVSLKINKMPKLA